MAKKESTPSSPTGMCEKLFNAFNPSHRSHRPLTYHHQGPGAATNPPPAQPNQPPVRPRPPAPDHQKKPSETIAPKAKPKPTTPPPPTSVPVHKVPDDLAPTPAPPKAATVPRPEGAAQPAPPPAPPVAAAAESSKKNINEKVEDYIKRAKAKIRTISGVGRSPPL